MELRSEVFLGSNNVNKGLLNINSIHVFLFLTQRGDITMNELKQFDGD